MHRPAIRELRCERGYVRPHSLAERFEVVPAFEHRYYSSACEALGHVHDFPGHLEEVEGEKFGPELVMRGSAERLSPILMTALATGLALVPLILGGNKPGHEIEYPMAVVILGGLFTSTILNLFLLPPLYAAYGRVSRASEPVG